MSKRKSQSSDPSEDDIGWRDVPFLPPDPSPGRRANSSGKGLEKLVGAILRGCAFRIFKSPEDFFSFKASRAFRAARRVAVHRMPYQSLYSPYAEAATGKARDPRCEWWLLLRRVPRIDGTRHQLLKHLDGLRGDISIHVECKNQNSSGSVDEKYPFVFLSAKTTIDDPVTIVILSGEGAREQAKKWMQCVAKERPSWFAAREWKKKRFVVLDGPEEFHSLLTLLLDDASKATKRRPSKGRSARKRRARSYAS